MSLQGIFFERSNGKNECCVVNWEDSLLILVLNTEIKRKTHYIWFVLRENKLNAIYIWF